jgi:hypothetical protein
MVSKPLVAAILTALLASGCGRTPQGAQLVALAATAPGLLSETRSGEIPKSKWPSGVAQLDPESVRAAPEGLYVVLSSAGVEEHGLFVPRAAGLAGSAGTDPSYTPIGQGVFSYHVKG